MIEVAIRVDQADDACLHEIAKIDLLREPLQDARSDEVHLGQFLEDQFVAVGKLPCIVRNHLVDGVCRCHNSLLLKTVLMLYRTTPTDCTMVMGGISLGEITTTLGRNGSSRRRK